MVVAVSLINRVLKDLEKRHAREVSDASTLPPEVRAASGAGPVRLPRYTWLLGLALILGALLWWWSDRAEVPGVPASAPSPGAVSTAPPPLANGPSPAPEAPASAPVPAPVAVAPELPLTPPAPVQMQPEPPPPAEEAAATPPDAQSPARRAGRTVERVAPEPDLELEPQFEPDSREAPGRIDKQVHPLAAGERAEQEFRRGMTLFQSGRTDEAEAAWRAALEFDPTAAAPRQALLGALLERGERERAETLLQDALRVNPRQPKQTMLLARLQLDRGAQSDALRTLEQGLPHAQWNAEYLSMTAAVMSRVGRHRDAAALYASALRIAPGNAVWEMGRGMALRAEGERVQALAAFQRASQMPGLSPELRAFVERQIRELQ